MSTANLTREETAARAAGIRLSTVDVDLDLRDARILHEDTFPATATLTFASDLERTWIDFLGAEVDEVVVNGVAQTVAWDGARIAITGLAAHNVVTIRARGRYSTSGEGLHRFRDTVDGEVYLYTQYEPADCRRVYPCFEQPDLKARWRFHVTGPEGWQILSNGAEIARTCVDGGVRVDFAETLPLSSYITAVAAGPYHRVDGIWEGGSRPVPLGVLCRASLAPHLDADEILDITRRGLSYLCDAFAYEYPWGTYDQIFVPEYNLGAMENPGLVTFTEAYVFRGASTRAQHEARANTILHEMTHMWFGDLVTMRWWDDLWLKESFADYMGTHVSAAAGGYPEAWVTFASRRKGWAYVQDQLPTTHPIVADIPDPEAAKLNFDGITYAKGASVLRQLVGYVGEEAFFAGARRYFADHAFGNTTLPDLLRALEAASGRDLTAWADAWLQTTGVSTVQIERGSGDLEVTSTLPRPDRVQIAFFAERDGRLVATGTTDADLSGTRTVIAAGGQTQADLILVNDDDRSYLKVRLDERSTDAVAHGLSSIDDALVRSVVWAALWNAVRDGELAPQRYLEIVAQHAPVESNTALLGEALEHAAFTVANYLVADDRAAWAARWLECCAAQMWQAPAGSDAQLAWARALGRAATYTDGYAEALRAMLEGRVPLPAGLALDPPLRWTWWIALAATGHAGPEDAERERAADPTASGQNSALTMLTARPIAEVRTEGWSRAWEDTALSNEQLDAVISGLRAGLGRELLAGLDGDYFARLEALWRERSIEIARRLVLGLFPASDSLDDVDAWLSGHPHAPAALRRLLIEQRDHLARTLRVRA